jgi:four helix bundle protein
MTTLNHSIADLRIYQVALELEEATYSLAKKLNSPTEFNLANSLRRSSAGVAHYIHDSYNCFSYELKIDALRDAIRQAETAIKQLETYDNQKQGKTAKLREDYQSLVLQTWGLIKYLRKRQEEKQARSAAAATDQLVASRTIK